MQVGLAPSSSGLGHRVFIPATGVRVSVGSVKEVRRATCDELLFFFAHTRLTGPKPPITSLSDLLPSFSINEEKHGRRPIPRYN